MKTEKLLFTVLLLLSLFLLLGTVAVAIPLALTGDGGDTSTEGGQPEETDYEYKVLYGPYRRQTPARDESGALDFRKNIKSIAVHSEKGDYSLVHPKNTDGAENYLSFLLRKDGETLTEVAVGDEAVSEAVAAFGSLIARLVTKDDAPARYAEYGIADSQSPAYFEITLYGRTLAETGDTLRVYIGNKTADGNGYYLRMDGTDAIYVSRSPTAGELVLGGMEYFVSPVLMPTLSEVNYYLAQNVGIYRETPVRTGVTAGAADAVLVDETVRIVTKDGEGNLLSETEETYTDRRYLLSDTAVPLLIRELMIGRTAGVTEDRTATVTETVPVAGGGSVLREETHTVHRVAAVFREETAISLSFINLYRDRDEFHAAGLYRLTAPADLAVYHANDSVIQGVLGSMVSLTGTKTYRYGFTEKDLLALGMHHIITLTVPKEFTQTEVTGSVSSLSGYDFTVSETVTVTLYVSDPLLDGTRYVASDYSDIIAVTDRSVFAFLDYDRSDWVSPNLVLSYMDIVETLTFSFRFTDFVKDYSFVHAESEKQGESYTKIPLRTDGMWKKIDFSAWQDLYQYVTFREYGGMCDLTAEEKAALRETEATVCMTFVLVDGRVFTYEFRPYSDRRALVTVIAEGQDGSRTVSEEFYFSTVFLKGLAEKVSAVAEGGECDINTPYGEESPEKP